MGILRRSLGLVLAVALVVAGLPLAHAMPAAAHSASHHAAAPSADSHGHHCDETAMDVAAIGDADHGTAAPPCKCLNCSMCVANFVAPVLRLATPEQRMRAVMYRTDAVDLAGIDARIDPGIPILAN